ncbi:hypothetical protein C8F04DRAFT_1185206 [Mycena alexandri]|uniref:Uncharacterized protein n=1 Tax=Mycena alexandri TaxID=1745969 RepID=A0AAD6SUQ9_9AGAR|nr:hypothetical protein C8F04DRAFT_1185206 [Mycena alexandri]
MLLLPVFVLVLVLVLVLLLLVVRRWWCRSSPWCEDGVEVIFRTGGLGGGPGGRGLRGAGRGSGVGVSRGGGRARRWCAWTWWMRPGEEGALWKTGGSTCDTAASSSAATTARTSKYAVVAGSEHSARRKDRGQGKE